MRSVRPRENRVTRLPAPIGVMAMLGLLTLGQGCMSTGCAGYPRTENPGLVQTLEPDLPQRIWVPSSREHRPPAVFALRVPETGALWLRLTCTTSGEQAVWLQGMLRDPRDPDSRTTLEPGPRGGVLKVPRVDAGVTYTLAVINLGAQSAQCDALFQVVPLEELDRRPTPLDVDQVATGTLFPWPGFDKRTFLVAVPERARVGVDARSETDQPPLVVSWWDDNGLVADGEGRLDLEEVSPGTYRLEVSAPPNAPPTPFAVAVSAVSTCEPPPVTLHNRRWQAVTLAPVGCHRVFAGQIRIDHATPLRLDLETDSQDRLEVRYQAPDRPWVTVPARSQDLPRVTTFGWHRIEVRLRPGSGGGLGAEVRLRLSFHQPCASLSGNVFDVRGDTVLADLHRWQGLRPGMRGYLKRDDIVVGRVEVVGVSSKATVLRVVKSSEPPRVGFRVVFPCR